MENWFEEDEEEFDMAVIEARHKEMEAEAVLDTASAKTEPGETSGIYPEHEWGAIIEAVLFTMGNSVELGQLAVAIGQSDTIARRVTENLQKRYQEERRGMQIIELDGAYQMSTRAAYYENLIRVAKAPKKQILSEVVLETLSIVAYKQPVTKAEITKIRGVSSDHAINRLVEYGLVYEAGRLDAPGRPALFATTEEFLRRFGVGSTIDLPTMNPEQEEEIKQEVEEELQFHMEAQEASVEKDTENTKS
ncbi:MAG: SMC-Scp complex subunit ScpB [Lachnospiraceae bacterium]